MLIILIHKHGRYVQILIISNCFFQRLEFLLIQVFHFLWELPQDIWYFLWLLWSMLFHWFLSQPFYHLYLRKLLIIFEISLYPALQVKVFISNRNSLKEFLGWLIYTIMSLVCHSMLRTNLCDNQIQTIKQESMTNVTVI